MVVEPVDPVERGRLDVFASLSGWRSMDHLGLVQAVDSLGQGVVVGVPNAADGRLQTGVDEALGVANGYVLDAAIAVMNQPTIRRAKTSTTTAK